MGKWTKHYKDGSSYVGEDNACRFGLASWTKSKATDIDHVQIEHNGYLISLAGDGEFWQSDDFEALVGDKNSKTVRRRISKMITPTDKFYSYVVLDKSAYITLNSGGQGRVYSFTRQDWGKWIVLELDLVKKTFTHYIRDAKL